MKEKTLHLKRALRCVLFILLLCMAGMTKGYAYDFSAVCETGQTLYYTITDATNRYVKITYPGSSTSSPWSGFTKPKSTLTIPSSVSNGGNTYTVTEIGEYAFYRCSDLRGSLTIPNSVTSIGNYAFYDCWFDKSLTIGSSVTTIGNYAFYDCNFTGSLTIPNSVISIGDKAFCYCQDFTGSLTIGNSVTSIGNYAFFNCTDFTGSLTIGSSVTTIGERAFYGCDFTGSLTIPNSVISIGDDAFGHCSGLTGALTIPSSVTSIGEKAFCACLGLTGMLIIPNSVTHIGSGAFSVCPNIQPIVVDEANTVYDSRENCNAIIETNSNKLISGCKNTIIPNSVTSIGNMAFEMCGLTGSLTIPSSVTSIGDYAFADCSGLTGSLTIPSSVTSIGDYAFAGCSGLTGALTIPNSVTYIGDYAFADCSGLTGALTIPNSVTVIRTDAFSYCSGLTEIIIYRVDPPILWNGVAFEDTYCPIYVPYESINSYKTAVDWGWESYKDRIYPMAYTTIPSYGESTGNYRFIASPLVGDTDPTAIDNLITASKYDLYRFDQSEDAEWQNYKDPNVNNFTIANGQGYLYANESEVNIIFKGAFNENGTQNVNLAYDDNAAFKGLNLVGNPFPVNAYINRSYYVMNDEGTEVTPVAVSTSTPIPACAGVMVFAESGETDPTVTFSKTAPQSANSNGSLQISVAHNSSKGSAIIDNAIVSFNDGDALGKYNFNDGDARLYIQQGSKELAIAYAGNQGEMPLNFKAKANGTYKISVNPEDVEMEYLHIIDNLTGNDTDLLQTPSYTFDASKADYASRFKLVFKANGVADNSSSADSETFAYCNGSEWVIENEGEATLQVIDLTGRILISEQISGSCSKTFSSHGVNMLRLINGDSVKTQKIVVR